MIDDWEDIGRKNWGAEGYSYSITRTLIADTSLYFRATSRPQLLAGGPSSLFTSSFAPFGCSGCVTHANDLDTQAGGWVSFHKQKSGGNPKNFKGNPKTFKNFQEEIQHLDLSLRTKMEKVMLVVTKSQL